MAGPLDLKGRVVIFDGASGPLNTIKNNLQSIAGLSKRIGSGLNGGRTMVGALAAGGAMFGLVNATKEFNEALWGAQAAFLGNVKATTDGEMVKGIADTREEAEKLRRTALDLSKTLGLMPETFMQAGEEAAKMGLDLEKSKAVMRAAGMVQMSDREAKANTMAKALGTYGIIYGAEADSAKYAVQVQKRASMLALAGAQTRTSASKIEEGMRNYMGIHGAFGGRFEDAVALIAMGSQIGQMEKETGTSLKSIQARFLNMPISGRSALAGAGIDIKQFMDFGGVDPMRATNQLVQMFPQQLGKGARGKMLKWMEHQRATGALNDPSIINRTVQMLESLGLKFAGDSDRENASNKVAAVMSGVGGRFDPLAMISTINKAIEEGKTGPGIWAAIGEPKRLHQYAGLMKIINETLKIRNGLLEDGGRYLELVARGYGASDAGKVVALESAWRRLQLTLMRSDGVQSMLGMFNALAERVESMPPWMGNLAGSALALGVVLGGVGFILAGVVAGLSALFSVPALVIAALAGVGAAAYYVYQNWDQVKAYMAGFWDSLKGTFSAGWEGLKSTMSDGWSAAIEGVKASWQGFSDWVGSWVNNIASAISSIAGKASSAWQTLQKLFSWRPWNWGENSGFMPNSHLAPGDSGDLLERALDSGALQDIRARADEIKTVFANLDLAGEGQRIMESLASGIRSGSAAAIGAANEAAAGIRGAMSNTVPLNTGPSMRPAK